MSNKVLIELGKHIKEHLKNHREREAVRFDVELLWLLKERDTSDVWRQIAIWILIDPKYGVRRFTKPGSDEHDVISKVAQLYIDDCKDPQTWKKVADYAAYTTDKDAMAPVNVAYAAARAEIDPVNLADAAARCHSYVAAASAAGFAHYERMADTLIKLLQAAPLINEKMINEQERIIDDMDHSKEISFSISHHNGTKHIMRGKETIEGAVNRIECALSIVKSVLKDDNTSECTKDVKNIDLNITSGRIIIT